MPSPHARPEIAEALDSEASPEDLSDLIRAATAAGALVHDPEQGVLLAGARLDRPACEPVWAARGYAPYRVKPLSVAPDAAARLGAAFRAVRLVPELLAVPHWMAEGMSVSLQHDDAVDLAEVALGEGLRPEVYDRVTDACLDSLTGFVDHDARLRAAIAERAPVPVVDFPLGPRYEAAVVALGRILGTAATTGIPEPDLTQSDSPRVLFTDPKPANFLLARDEVADWLLTGTPRPCRVDLDLMSFESTLGLQAALAVFSHPLGPRDGSGDLRFAEMLAKGRAYVAARGVRRTDFDAVVFYHLIRNFTSAVQDGRRRKAIGFAEALETAVPELPLCSRLGPLAEAARGWREAAERVTVPASRRSAADPAAVD